MKWPEIMVNCEDDLVVVASRNASMVVSRRHAPVTGVTERDGADFRDWTTRCLLPPPTSAAAQGPDEETPHAQGSQWSGHIQHSAQALCHQHEDNHLMVYLISRRR